MKHRRRGPAATLSLDLAAHGLEPVMRPVTAGLAVSLACFTASGLFVLDTGIEGYGWVPLSFLALAVAFGLARRRPPAPPADPDKIATARAVLSAFGTDPVTLDVDLHRDPWLRVETEHGRAELSASDALSLEPPDAELQQRIESALG